MSDALVTKTHDIFLSSIITLSMSLSNNKQRIKKNLIT